MTPVPEKEKPALPTKPDAIFLPSNCPVKLKGDPNSFLARCVKEFAPVFGCTRVTVGSCIGGHILVPFAPVEKYVHPQYHFPANHSLQGQLRHVWIDRGDGILYGMMADDPDAAEKTEGEPSAATIP